MSTARFKRFLRNICDPAATCTALRGLAAPQPRRRHGFEYLRRLRATRRAVAGRHAGGRARRRLDSIFKFAKIY